MASWQPGGLIRAHEKAALLQALQRTRERGTITSVPIMTIATQPLDRNTSGFVSNTGFGIFAALLLDVAYVVEHVPQHAFLHVR
jgi:hypothetical protein